MKAKTVVLILLCLVIAGGIAFIFKDFIFGSETGPLYESRLLGIENHEISEDALEAVETALLESEFIVSCDAFITGKVIKIIIETDTEDTQSLKEVLDTSVDFFDPLDLEYYDFELLVDNANNTELYPIIGYKNNKTETISYTNQGEQ